MYESNGISHPVPEGAGLREGTRMQQDFDLRSVDFMGLFPDDLEDLFDRLGLPRYRGRQVFRWIHRNHETSFYSMTDLPLDLREELSRLVDVRPARVLAKQESRDGTVKYLVGFDDGNAVEAARMKYEYGITACISSQIGCKMACRMCASGMSGFVRNLRAGEMVDLMGIIDKDVREIGGRVRNIVMMGSGEPLDNYNNVLRFLKLMNEPMGLDIGFRRMTISTCGIVPGINKLAREGLPITLSVSLHAPSDDIRDEIMPINRRYPIALLLEACKEYIAASGRRVTFEYSLMRGLNDGLNHARELAALLSGMLCHVNLIPVNPVNGGELERSSPERIRAFAQVLRASGINVTVRRALGEDIDAACGQLRRRFYSADAGERAGPSYGSQNMPGKELQ